MSRYNLIFIVFLLSISGLFGQYDTLLSSFNAERLMLNQQGMTVLGSWAVGQMAWSGLSLALSEPRPVARHFHQMNLGWNAVNLVIAGFGYYGSLEGATDLSWLESVREQEKIKTILLVNAGLDLAYMAGGAYLLERAKSNPERAAQWTGFGRAVIMNGAFLLVFDSILYAVHLKHGNTELYEVLQNLQLSPQGIGFRWQF